jgi:hypothetical protein
MLSSAGLAPTRQRSFSQQVRVTLHIPLRVDGLQPADGGCEAAFVCTVALRSDHCRPPSPSRRCRPQSVGSEGSVDSRGSRISRGSGTQHRLFVGNLLPTTTVEELKAYFSQFGSVVDVFLPRLTGPSASRCVRRRAGGGSPPLRRVSPGSPCSRSG